MSTSAQHTQGTFHIRFNLRGEESKIRTFHNILTRADSDYPFGKDRRYVTIQFCPSCNAVCWSNPRLNPEDIKVAARQAGVRVKIKRFAPEDKCRKDGAVKVVWIDTTLAHMLYRPDGVLEIRKKLEEEGRIASEGSACSAAKPLLALPPSTHTLEAEVLGIDSGDGNNSTTDEPVRVN